MMNQDCRGSASPSPSLSFTAYKYASRAVLIAAVLGLAACGGGGGGDGGGGGGGNNPPPTYSIGGSISGLTATGLSLGNGSDTISPASGATSFTMPTSVASGTTYAVTVKTQPTGLTCTVTNGSGTVSSAAITNVAVACTPAAFSINGAITGLTASGLVLANGSATTSPPTGSTTFTLPAGANGASYSVVVQAHPTGLSCQVTNGTGTVAGANVTNVSVACVASTYSLSGSISGLSASGLVLADGSDTVSPAANATSFSLPTAKANGAAYNLVVQTQPTGLTCQVTNGTGTIPGANVTNVTIACAPATYSIGGSITGLTVSGLVLTDGSDTVSPAANATSFTLPTAKTNGASYNVVIQTQPTGATCQITNGSGTVNAAAITNIAVACTALPTYRIGGTATGVSADGIVLANGADTVTINTGATSFAFPVRQLSGTTYQVIVQSLPPNITCEVTNPSGTVATADVTSPILRCAAGRLTSVSGSLSANATGTYGTIGVADPTNHPGARRDASAWNGNGELWLFGGKGYDAAGPAGLLNDLWKYTVSTGRWTWVAGLSTQGGAGVYGTQGVSAPTNTPGARALAASWADADGNLWLFGGNDGGYRNDMWKFTVSTGEWTWFGGSNTTGAAGVYGTIGTAAPANAPGARIAAAWWTDSYGKFWMFGGDGVDSASGTGPLNDLWQFDPAVGTWKWVGGANTVAGATGSYGTLGLADANNVPPGRREGAATWVDPTGKLWMFGGRGPTSVSVDNKFSDLWVYDPGANKWTWVGGPNTLNGLPTYGTKTLASTSNIPGPRYSMMSWTRGTSLYLLGGHGTDSAGNSGPLNDLWQYNVVTGEWSWNSGADTTGAAGIYGTPVAGGPPAQLGAREGGAAWQVGTDLYWLFGGYGYSSNDQGYLNDLWKYQR